MSAAVALHGVEKSFGATQVIPGIDRKRIVDWTKHGGRLATAQPDLLDDLGVRLKGPVLVKAATMQGMPGKATWLPPLTIGSLLNCQAKLSVVCLSFAVKIAWPV